MLPNVHAYVWACQKLQPPSGAHEFLVDLPEAFFEINIAQLHVHAGGPDGVDDIQHLLQLLQGDWSLVQLLIQPLQLLFQPLQDPGRLACLGRGLSAASLCAKWHDSSHNR